MLVTHRICNRLTASISTLFISFAIFGGNAFAKETMSTRELQLGLIWLGHLNAEAGKVGLAEYERAVKAFQKSIATPTTGQLSSQEALLLKQQSAAAAVRAGFELIDDPRTGVRIGFPKNLFQGVQPSISRRGSEWSFEGKIVLDTIRIPLGTPENGVLNGVVDVRTFFRNLLNMTDLQVKTFPPVSKLPLGTESFTLEGIKGPKGAPSEKKFHFHVRSNETEIRAFAFAYPASLSGLYEPIANAIASTFDPFPTSISTVPVALTSSGPIVSPAFAPPKLTPTVGGQHFQIDPLADSQPLTIGEGNIVRNPIPKGSGIALVIGNSAYQHETPLDNPLNDANGIAEALRKLGIRTEKVLNLPRLEMEAKIVEFAKGLRDNSADLGFFYYAGHGIQVAGTNYLLPVDAKISRLEDIKTNAVSLDFLLDRMEGRNRKTIIVLDACRDSPFTLRRLRSAAATRGSGERPTELGNGLAPVSAGLDTYIAYSTRPGSVARDGTGRNSPFAKALMRHLAGVTPTLPNIMMPIRQDVLADTNNEQLPWAEDGLSAPVVLARQIGR